MISIYDIAKEAGVSKSTVSRVVNNQPGVIDSKREKVLQAIEKLDYKPHSAARNLALKKTNVVAVFVRELSANFYAEFVHDINHIFDDEFNYGAIYCNRNSHSPSRVDYLGLVNKSVDGYIFIGEDSVTEKELEVLVRAGESVVVLGTNLKVDGVLSIDVNNYEVTYEAIKHLIDLGHQKIIHIGAAETSVEFKERHRGYEQALKDFGLTYNSSRNIGYEYEDAYQYGLILADEVFKEGLTAAFCFNDTAAVGLINGLQEKGIKVPKDFSVVGFDDLPLVRMTKDYIPPLTTIRQPQKDMAIYAVHSLHDMMNHVKKTENRVYKCELKIRETTSKPR